MQTITDIKSIGASRPSDMSSGHTETIEGTHRILTWLNFPSKARILAFRS